MMPKNNSTWRGYDLQRIIFSAIAIAFCGLIWNSSLNQCVAQESIDNGRRALEKSDFPWYGDGLNENGSFELPAGERAKSLDRGKVPAHIPTAPTPQPNYSFWNMLSGMFSWLFGGYWGLSVVGWIVVAMTAILLGVLLVWLGAKMGLVFLPGRDDFEDEEDENERAERVKELPFQLAHQPGDLRTQARAAYDSGDFRRAMTLLFSHVLLSLDRRHFIRLRRGKTNRQYLRELKQYDLLTEYFQLVMVPFEETFFGDHQLSKSVFEDCWGKLNVFQESINQSSQVETE